MGRRAESAGVAVAAVWPLRAQTNGQGKSANLRQCHPVVRRLGYGLNLAAYGGAGVRTKFVLGGQNGADQRRCAGDAARSEIASAKRFKYTMTPVVDAPAFVYLNANRKCQTKVGLEGLLQGLACAGIHTGPSRGGRWPRVRDYLYFEFEHGPIAFSAAIWRCTI